MDAVGVIGLGLMGSALAQRVRQSGLRVVGFDKREECRRRLTDLGGEAFDSVPDVFASAQTVLLSLPDSPAVASVIEAAGPSVRGVLIVDTTTGEPGAAEAIGPELAGKGADYLDATLTGSSAEARAGEVVVTAGGRPEVFARAVPLFRLFAKRWFHVGPWGSGTRMKLVVNLVLGLHRAVLAEGLGLAHRWGLHLPSVLEILRSGAAYSRVMDVKGRKMIEGDFAPQARLSQHLKDVRLILAAGRPASAVLPLTALHEQILVELAERGLGELDNSAVIRAFVGDGS